MTPHLRLLCAARASERGGATVLALAGVGVLLVLCLGGAAVGSAVVAMHRARAAADLGALAAAGSLAQGSPPGDACAAGLRLVRANAASLSECDPAEDGSVTVTTTVPAGLPFPGVGWTARAAGRAGPAP